MTGIRRPEGGAASSGVRRWFPASDDRGWEAGPRRVKPSRRILKSPPGGLSGTAFAIGILILLSPFLVSIASILRDGIPDAPRAGDAAILEISTRNTAHGLNLTGPSSRLEFDHPGPLYFLLRIPLYFLSGFAASSSLITSSLLWSFCLAATVWMVFRHGSPGSAFLGLPVLAAYLRAICPTVWLNDWNAFVVVPAMMLFVLSLAAAASGRRIFYTTALLAGSFAAQTHLGCIPSVLLLAAAAILLDLRSSPRGERRSISRNVLVSLLAAGIVWLPVLYEQITSADGGNISAIVSYFLRTPHEPVTIAYIRAWAVSLTSFEFPPLLGGHLRSSGLLSEFYMAILLNRLALLAACWFISRRSGGGRFLRVLCILSLLLHAATLLSTLQVRGGLYQHLTVWFTIAAPISWIAALGIMAQFLGIRATPVLVVPALVLTAAGILSGLPGGAAYLPALDPDERVSNLADGFQEAFPVPDGAPRFLLLGDHGLWPLMTGLVNELQKRGYDCGIDPAYTSMTGVAPPPDALPVLLSSDSMWDGGFTRIAGDDDAALGIR